MSGAAKLAIDGGRPVRPELLPYGRQTIDDEDVRVVVEVLRSPYLTTGPRVEAFEEALASMVGARHAVVFANGTAALHAAAFAAGIGPGDEVVTTPMTFAATANCVRYQGGDVRFADVRLDTLNLAAEAAEAATSEGTRAVIAVDFTGQPADLDELSAVAGRRGALLIEDAAHALGATYRGRPIGSVAALTTFSFHPVKQITTGEGGAVTTGDEQLARRLRLFRNHGIDTDHHQRRAGNSWEYQMQELGYNYRLTDLQCALGLSQIGRLPGIVRRRREIAERYAAALASIAEIQPPTVLADRESAWHLYVIRLRLDRLRVGRGEVFRALRAENIGVNVHYIPVPWHPYYRRLGYGPGGWPVAEGEYERLLSLPMWPGMTDEDVDLTVEALHKVVAAYRK